MDWTIEQEKAINTNGSNIIVSAGAGSGKTAVLTARTIKNLNDFSLNEMIILTFTKKAAFSMKEKIKKALKKSNNEKVKKNLKLLDSASICTFDSFSLDLVKKYSDLLNVEPNIQIADEVVIASLKNRIIDEVFDAFYEDKRFLDFLDIYTVKDDTSIKKDILEILNNLDKIYDPVKYLDTYQNNQDEFILEYKNLIDLKHQKLKEIYEELLNLATKKEEKFLADLSTFMNFKTIEDYFLFQNFNLQYRLKGNDSFKEKFKEFKAIVDEIKELAIYSSEEEIKEELEEVRKYIPVLVDLLKEIIIRINKYKEEHSLYEFNDITRLAIKVLDENPDIVSYYKNNIKEIMIDEYQDTNDIQDYFISKIANNNVFMVGDVKQSIYRFRNANPKIFIQKYNDYKNNIGGIKIDLTKNFRSRKEVIDNINSIFSKIMTEKIGGAEYKIDHQMKFGYEKYGENKDHNLKILNYNKDNYKNFGNNEIEAFIIAQDIKNKYENKYQIFDTDTNKYRDFKYQDAAILLSTKKEFDLYKKIFDYFDIPLIVHKDEDLTYSNELIFIKNVVKLIGYHKNIIDDGKLIKTYMSVARSFALNYSDNDIFKVILASKNNNLFNHIDLNLKEKIVYLSEFIDNHSISELLKEILNIFDVYNKIGSLNNKELIEYKISHLLNIAISLESMDYHLEEFINYLEDASLEDIDFKLSSNKSLDLGVNLMTIHASKGLDFKICYFADLNKEFSIREIKNRFLFSPKYGLIIPVFKEGIKPTIYKTLYKNEYIAEEISERIRLFYVALTRTKEDMIFVTDLSEKEIKLDDNTRMNYRSFKDILESVKADLKDFIINASDFEINRKYEYIKIKKEVKEFKTFETIDINIEKERVEETKYSHSVTELKDNILLEFGSKIHEYLEYIDFNDFDASLNSLDINDFFKNKIELIKNQPFLKENAIYHKEYEFMFNGNIGKIDLLIETDDKLIVVDYKLKEIDEYYYFDQVRGYMNYLKTISNKEIEGYLYSIFDGVYIKVEEQSSSFCCKKKVFVL